MVYNVNMTCLRYVVAFTYNNSFENACAAVQQQKEEVTKKNKETGEKEKTGEYRNKWIRRVYSINGSESDLYDYVKKEILFDDFESEQDEEKPGCEWIYWRSALSKNGDGRKIANLLYFPDGISATKLNLSDAWDIAISNVGLILFRNGLGFFWYELTLPNSNINSDKLKKFQNYIKELNRGERSFLWEKCKEEPQFGLVTGVYQNGKTGQKHKKWISPFSLGMWIQDQLKFLNINYLASRKASYNHMLKNSIKAIKDLENEKRGMDISLTMDCELAPDKAILFTYCVFDADNTAEDDGVRETMAFHLTNGYIDSYHYSKDLAADMKKPFSDVIWYATQEGTSYLSWPGSDNKKVFEILIPTKVKTDYFTLYLKVLYQSFSLLIYAQRIQSEISAVNGKYLIEPLDARITELFGEINLFLTKSMATSVSHIHHQSEFYIYLKKQLRVHDDVKSVTAGLNALDTLQREQRQQEERLRIAKEWQEDQRRDREVERMRQERAEREKKMEEAERQRDNHIQAGVGLFSVLAIGSALIDMYDFIAKFIPGSDGGWSELFGCLPVLIIEIIFTILIMVIGGVACKFAWRAFRKSDDETDNMEN